MARAASWQRKLQEGKHNEEAGCQGERGAWRQSLQEGHRCDRWSDLALPLWLGNNVYLVRGCRRVSCSDVGCEWRVVSRGEAEEEEISHETGEKNEVSESQRQTLGLLLEGVGRVACDSGLSRERQGRWYGFCAQEPGSIVARTLRVTHPRGQAVSHGPSHLCEKRPASLRPPHWARYS